MKSSLDEIIATHEVHSVHNYKPCSCSESHGLFDCSSIYFSKLVSRKSPHLDVTILHFWKVKAQSDSKWIKTI